MVVVPMAAAFAPPTVSDTKARYLKTFSKPINSIYNNVIQELLVQMHFVRYGKNYKYNEVFALGCVNVFDQVLESLDEQSRKEIFQAFLGSLDETPEKFRQDAEELEQLAGKLSGPADLAPEASGSKLQAALANLKSQTASGEFAYNKFTAIGLFRLLELTGAKEPAALERLVKAVGVSQDAVNRDLVLYKGVLSKLSAAKEMLQEFLEREKRKQAEREAEKAAKAAKPAEVQA